MLLCLGTLSETSFLHTYDLSSKTDKGVKIPQVDRRSVPGLTGTDPHVVFFVYVFQKLHIQPLVALFSIPKETKILGGSREIREKGTKEQTKFRNTVTQLRNAAYTNVKNKTESSIT